MKTRRDFLKSMAAVTAGVLADEATAAPSPARDRLGDLLPQRKLGSTGETVTMLGVGGFHIGGSMSDKTAQATIEAALEGGVRFFDTAERYQRGESEKRYGRYLTPKYREQVFLMTKTRSYDAASAKRHLEDSLRRLNTDYLDLWQMHSLQSPRDVDRRLDQDVLDVLREAKASGKVRHIGFTGHAMPAAHLRMLERTDVHEVCQLPVSVVDAASEDSFVQRVLPVLLKRKMGILAMKSLADGRFFARKKRVNWKTPDPVVPDRVKLEQALGFVWSLPVSVLITGPDNPAMMREKIRLAAEFATLDSAARRELIGAVADLAEKGRVEYYKKS